MQYFRSKIFDLFAVAWTLSLAPSAIGLWFLRSPERHLRAVAQLWVRGLMWGLSSIVKLRYIERGRENIPADPCIILANHQSAWETLVLARKFPTASFVTKREAGRIPIVGWFLKNYPMIMVDRGGGGTAIRKLVADSRATLAEGRSVIIFPEGTRKGISDRIVFKRGVEFLYADLGRPILPIAVNSGVFWGRDRPMKYDGTITISYLPVIEPGLPVDEFRRKAEALLEAERDRLIRELNTQPSIEALG